MSENLVNFPVGYYRFNNQKVFNFQLNRWHSFGLAKFDDCISMGKDIKTFQDWTETMTRFAECAEQEGRLLNAAIYYRSSEFYTTHDDVRKKQSMTSFPKCFIKPLAKKNSKKRWYPMRSVKYPS